MPGARLAGVKTNVAREGFVWANILSGVCWIPAPAGGSWAGGFSSWQWEKEAGMGSFLRQGPTA